MNMPKPSLAVTAGTDSPKESASPQKQTGKDTSMTVSAPVAMAADESLPDLLGTSMERTARPQPIAGRLDPQSLRDGSFDGLTGIDLIQAIHAHALFVVNSTTKMGEVKIPAGAIGRVEKVYAYFSSPTSFDVSFDVDPNADLPRNVLVDEEGRRRSFHLDEKTATQKGLITWLTPTPPPSVMVRMDFTEDTSDRRVLQKLLTVLEASQAYMNGKGRKLLDGLCEAIRTSGIEAKPRMRSKYSMGKDRPDWYVELKDLDDSRGVDVRVGEKDPQNFIHGLGTEISKLRRTVEGAPQPLMNETKGFQVSSVVKAVSNDPPWTMPEIGFEVINTLIRFDSHDTIHPSAFESCTVDPKFFLSQVQEAESLLVAAEAQIRLNIERMMARLGASKDMLQVMKERAMAATQRND